MSDLRLEDLRRMCGHGHWESHWISHDRPYHDDNVCAAFLVTAAEVASACPTEVLINELRRRGVQPVDLMLPGKGVRIPLEDDDEPVAGGVS